MPLDKARFKPHPKAPVLCYVMLHCSTNDIQTWVIDPALPGQNQSYKFNMITERIENDDDVKIQDN